LKKCIICSGAKKEGKRGKNRKNKKLKVRNIFFAQAR